MRKLFLLIIPHSQAKISHHMEDGHNWRIWNWPGFVKIKPRTIHSFLNSSLGRYISFVLVPVAEGSF